MRGEDHRLLMTKMISLGPRLDCHPAPVLFQPSLPEIVDGAENPRRNSHAANHGKKDQDVQPGFVLAVPGRRLAPVVPDHPRNRDTHHNPHFAA